MYNTAVAAMTVAAVLGPVLVPEAAAAERRGVQELYWGVLQVQQQHETKAEAAVVLWRLQELLQELY
jgi:hypothetical protein